MALEVRECRRGDLGRVYEIELTSFPHPYDFNVFEEYQTRVERSDYDGFLVADEGSELLGYLIFEYGRKGLIVSMAVRTDARRRMVGTALLREALRRLSKRCKAATLQVGVKNTPAQELYRGFGFSIVGILPHYYPDGEDAYQMEASRLQHDAAE